MLQVIFQTSKCRGIVFPGLSQSNRRLAEILKHATRLPTRSCRNTHTFGLSNLVFYDTFERANNQHSLWLFPLNRSSNSKESKNKAIAFYSCCLVDLFSKSFTGGVTFFPVTSLVTKTFAYLEFDLHAHYAICRHMFIVGFPHNFP